MVLGDSTLLLCAKWQPQWWATYSLCSSWTFSSRNFVSTDASENDFAPNSWAICGVTKLLLRVGFKPSAPFPWQHLPSKKACFTPWSLCSSMTPTSSSSTLQCTTSPFFGVSTVSTTHTANWYPPLRTDFRISNGLLSYLEQTSVSRFVFFFLILFFFF